MRTFAFLMLFVNLIYLAWGQVGRDDDRVELSADQTGFISAEQSLKLLSELSSPATLSATTSVPLPVTNEPIPVVPAADVARDVSPAVAPAQIDEPVLRCELISGFADQAEAEAFISELADKNVSGELALEQEQISSTWWVHLPPFASQAEAQAVINELVIKGIDNFYMRTGELAGGISLGVFRSEGSAITAQAELKGRGYETSIREIPRYLSKAYVTLEESESGALTSAEWLAFLASKQNLAATEKLCETIAP